MTDATRKAAIFFRSLEPESAAVLLAQLSTDEARAIRDAVRGLGEVTDEERDRIASEVLFASEEKASRRPAVSDGVELKLSTAPEALETLAVEPTPIAEPSATGPAHPFASHPQLEQADAQALAAYLDRENAGVVAVVLSYLSPSRAAAVLDELRFDQRAEAIERLAELGDGDPEALNVLATDLATWITRRQEQQTRQADRLAAIGAILGAAAPTCRDDLLSRLQSRGCAWAAGLAAPPVETPNAEEVEQLIEGLEVSVETPSNDEVVDATVAQPPRPLSAPFASLERLNPRLLAEVVRRTPPRQVLLALAGATESLQRRIESLLPARQARELRKRIESLGPTRMQDIDAAQHAMASVASELWDFFYGKRAA